MNGKQTAKYVIRLGVTLFLITAIVAAALACVNSITAPRIAAETERKTQEAIEKVLPGGGKALEPGSYDDQGGLVTQVYASDTGYAVKVAPSGFDGTITMMVGVGLDGKVLGISIISHTETAGLGAVAASDTPDGESFRQQFKGLSGTLSVKKDGGTVDQLSGATVTSRGVTRGVNAALACVAGLG
ncbi:MAG: RnfABCDGE type electron transport complex subunit G [Firmicutes bacterium]|nr:RnfABCDGE type electron transport complex subunit G [Bacillota bacterium]